MFFLVTINSYLEQLYYYDSLDKVSILYVIVTNTVEIRIRNSTICFSFKPHGNYELESTTYRKMLRRVLLKWRSICSWLVQSGSDQVTQM